MEVNDCTVGSPRKKSRGEKSQKSGGKLRKKGNYLLKRSEIKCKGSDAVLLHR